ncbi:MAG: hypothetical protein FWH17_02500 [Oscillospiraceae bacterium]|nr:hypothetical protein [Oscillospiraceae bacterium]
MSGTQRANQSNAPNYKTPEQRATIQAEMLTAIEGMAGPDAVERDMTAFFGGFDNVDFSPEQTCGIIGLEDPKMRLTMARLYMLYYGYEIGDVFSQREDDITKKENMGRDFCEIIFSGDITRVGPLWSNMTKYLNDVKIRPADLLDDERFTDHYQEMAFYRDAAIFLGASMGMSDDGSKQEEKSDIWDDWLAPEEQQNFPETHKAMYGIHSLINTTAIKITDGRYSSENNAKRATLESVLPGANQDWEDMNISIFMGHTMLEELEILGISGLTNYDIPLRELARLSEPLAKVWTRDFREFAEEPWIHPQKYKTSFDDLMDFEQLDFDDPLSENKKLTVPVLTQTVQNERDRVQTLLFDQLGDRYGKKAEAKDIEFFFGERKDNDFRRGADTPPGRPFDLDIKTRRLSMVRLYMVAVCGISVEDVFSQDITMMEQKQAIGEEFCNLMLGDDAAEIAEANAKMARYLMSAKIPNIDLSNDASVVENYATARFLENASTALFQSMAYPGSHDAPPRNKAAESIVANFRALMTQEELVEYNKFHYGLTNVYKMAIAPKITEITSENYSGANDARRDGISFGNHEVINGKVPDIRFINAVSSALNVSNLVRDRFMEDAGKGFGALADIEFNQFLASNVSPEQTREIKAQYRKPGDAAPEKTTRESLSLGEFQMEVETIKHTKRQAEVRETAKQGIENTRKVGK